MPQPDAAKPKPAEEPQTTTPTADPAAGANPLSGEYDRRGIKLPARSLIGGIITPM